MFKVFFLFDHLILLNCRRFGTTTDNRYKPIQLKTPKHRSLTKPYRPNTYYNGHIQNRLLSYTTQATWKQDSLIKTLSPAN